MNLEAKVSIPQVRKISRGNFLRMLLTPLLIPFLSKARVANAGLETETTLETTTSMTPEQQIKNFADYIFKPEFSAQLLPNPKLEQSEKEGIKTSTAALGIPPKKVTVELIENPKTGIELRAIVYRSRPGNPTRPKRDELALLFGEAYRFPTDITSEQWKDTFTESNNPLPAYELKINNPDGNISTWGEAPTGNADGSMKLIYSLQTPTAANNSANSSSIPPSQ